VKLGISGGIINKSVRDRHLKPVTRSVTAKRRVFNHKYPSRIADYHITARNKEGNVAVVCLEPIMNTFLDKGCQTRHPFTNQSYQERAGPSAKNGSMQHNIYYQTLCACSNTWNLRPDWQPTCPSQGTKSHRIERRSFLIHP